ncbi:MAG: hypothetical protein KJT03_17285, partial [Verrucomicrobiae bacterium]|nr:hypothetical protein [Verrucomicrobiae bacterium]
PDRVYGDPMAMTISIWYVENYRDGLTTAEIEPKGPLETLYPGERMSFTEEWYLTDHPFPKDKANIDVESVLEASKKVIGH